MDITSRMAVVLMKTGTVSMTIIVRAVNMEYELTTRLVRENAYLLFYERCF